MPVTKRIVCLPNSRKFDPGRCIAGCELGRPQPTWVRPVGSRPHEEVSEEERRYENGAEPRVLDIIDIPLLGPKPNGDQRENWLLDPNQYWVKVGEYAWEDLQRLVDNAPLWTNGNSTYNGLNDFVPLEQAMAFDTSLKLIRVQGLEINVFRPGQAFGNPKRRVQARFRHSGTFYALWVTDPFAERKYLMREDGRYQEGPAYLTVSLGEPHEGRAYKLVAAIILPEGA